mmetsp:Transcript_12168/g.38904  ORF Transcript_12168/g.38904 Transcript_12168/m.38904 type:complete len:341 (+) Transcript_12168:666-1688(+)
MPTQAALRALLVAQRARGAGAPRLAPPRHQPRACCRWHTSHLGTARPRSTRPRRPLPLPPQRRPRQSRRSSSAPPLLGSPVARSRRPPASWDPSSVGASCRPIALGALPLGSGRSEASALPRQSWGPPSRSPPLHLPLQVCMLQRLHLRLRLRLQWAPARATMLLNPCGPTSPQPQPLPLPQRPLLALTARPVRLTLQELRFPPLRCMRNRRVAAVGGRSRRTAGVSERRRPEILRWRKQAAPPPRCLPRPMRRQLGWTRLSLPATALLLLLPLAWAPLPPVLLVGTRPRVPLRCWKRTMMISSPHSRVKRLQVTRPSQLAPPPASTLAAPLGAWVHPHP